MNKLIFFLIVLLLLTACGQQSDSVIVDDSKVIATVGKYQVTEAYLTAFLNSNGLSEPSKQQKAQGLDSIIEQLSLAHQADKDGLKLSQQQAFEIEQAKHRALAQAAIEQHLAANPVEDTDVQAEYQRITDELNGEEFHVRHLLFQDEVEAFEVLDRMNSGDSYANAETAYLLANPQVKNVGNIGWVNIMQVPEVFREPLQSMQTKSVHPEVLISQYGVHVLYLEGKRPLLAPELHAVEAGIRKTLTQQKIDRYQQLVVIKAKVKMAEKK